MHILPKLSIFFLLLFFLNPYATLYAVNLPLSFVKADAYVKLLAYEISAVPTYSQKLLGHFFKDCLNKHSFCLKRALNLSMN